MKNRNWFDRIGNCAEDLMVCAIGILFLTNHVTGWRILYILTISYSFYSAFGLAWSIIRGYKSGSKMEYLLIAIQVGFAVYLLLTPDDYLHWVHVFYGWWMLLHAYVYLVTWHVDQRDELRGAAGMLAAGIISALLGIFMIFGRNLNAKTDLLTLFAGIYFIGSGLISLAYHLLVTNPDVTPEKRRTFSVPMPVFFSIFLPLRAYISISKLIKESGQQLKPEEPDADLRVYVYLKGEGPEILGHLDIAYQGTIYSYGCHDPLARKMFGIYGDGVLMVSEEKAFRNQHLEVEHKTILSYGICLTAEEKKQLEQNIAHMMARTIPWKPKAQICEEKGIPFEGFHDYASRVYEYTHCQFYKFTKGQFRTYFVTYTNCVLLADTLIRNKDLNLIDLSGIVTPGAYLSFLNSEYLNPNSIVVSRTLYQKPQR